MRESKIMSVAITYLNKSVSPAVSRQIAKTGSYSLMHLMVAVTVAYILSGDWRIALGIGIVEPLVQTVAYTLHERVWSKFGS